jgi:hypothetical protein
MKLGILSAHGYCFVCSIEDSTHAYDVEWLLAPYKAKRT